MKTRWLWPFILACGLSACVSSAPPSSPDPPSAKSSPVFPDRYDSEIRKAVKVYWPDFPYWLAWKAQLYQESRLDPEAVSPVGATGLAQFMPGTWDEVTRALGWGIVSPKMAKPAIHAGAYYMGRLRSQWSAPRPQLDRHKLAEASYNAGLGNLLKAQKRCHDAALYLDIIRCLPAVTGKHSEETIQYVRRIQEWWEMMK